jgi:hypothetical protein
MAPISSARPAHAMDRRTLEIGFEVFPLLASARIVVSL